MQTGYRTGSSSSGAGLAGIVAAIHAQREGAEVVLIDRGPIGTGTNSCLANAYFAGPVTRYSADAYLKDTLETGRSINQRPVVDFLAQEAPSAFRFLRSLGLAITEAPTGLNVNSSVSGVIPGVTLMRTLAETLKKLAGIQARKGFYVTEIVTGENRVLGIRGIDGDGEDVFYAASTVVLATGGAGAVYLRNDNQKRILGQGYYLAAKAGLPLWDMEFVQFYPLVLAEPGYPSLILFPPYPREVKTDQWHRRGCPPEGRPGRHQYCHHEKKRCLFRLPVPGSHECPGLYGFSPCPGGVMGRPSLHGPEKAEIRFPFTPHFRFSGRPFFYGWRQDGRPRPNGCFGSFCLRGNPMGPSRCESHGRKRPYGMCRHGLPGRTMGRPIRQDSLFGT